MLLPPKLIHRHVEIGRRLIDPVYLLLFTVLALLLNPMKEPFVLQKYEGNARDLNKV